MEPQEFVLQQGQPPNLHHLPPELLDHIMFFLPPRSIVHLMANRKLRSACEQFLYRDIDVGGKPNRSLHLLRTFVLRPDLALLVRRLRISLEWCIPESTIRYRIPHLLQPDGIAALSLAKNIRSLGLPGLGWLSHPSLAYIYEMVSQMELTSLDTIEYYSPNSNIDVMMSTLRSRLLSFPKLEDLSLKLMTNPINSATGMAVLNKTEFQVPDIPSLNRFREDVRLAKAFLNAATKLSTLDLFFQDNDPLHKLLREKWNGNSINDLHVKVDFGDVRDWAVFGGFLACFPNVKSLTLLSIDIWCDDPIPPYSHDIAPQLQTLTRLRTLEIGNLGIKDTSHPDPPPESVLLFKKYSPTLQRFVDPNARQWVYVPSDGDGGDFLPRVECQLVERQRWTGWDLPPPKWDV